MQLKSNTSANYKSKLLNQIFSPQQENMRGQRGTLRALAGICQSLKLFLVSGSLFSETSVRITT